MTLSLDTVAHLRAQAQEIIARYPAGRERSALLPLLHLVQSEEGHVSADGIAFCAEVLGLTKAEVGAVATFYTMYKRRPVGDWLVSVCTNTMCGVLGGDATYRRLSEHLGVGHDETTAEGDITLEHAECLAACDYAPVMTVNYEFFDQIDPDTAVEIVDALRRGERPLPTRGAHLCTFKEMARQLAGFLDDRPDAVAEGPAGEPTLAGVRIAEEHSVPTPPYDPDTPIGREPEQPAAPAPAQTGGSSGRSGDSGVKSAEEAGSRAAGESDAHVGEPRAAGAAAEAKAEGSPDTVAVPPRRDA